MNVEPGERALVINSNCRAFTTLVMRDRVYLSHADNLCLPQYAWWQLAILRAYFWLSSRWNDEVTK